MGRRWLACGGACAALLLAWAPTVLSQAETALPEPEAPKMDAHTIAERFLRACVEKRYSAAELDMDPELARALPQAALAAALEQLQQDHDIDGLTHLAGEPLGEKRVEVFLVERGEQPLFANVVVLPNGKVGGLHFQPGTARKTPNESIDDAERLVTGIGPAKVSGAVVLPKVPAMASAVIVPGSGSQDRDGPLGGPRLLAGLARALARHGIATIRYDKRPLVGPAKSVTLDAELVDDAVAALAWLRSDPDTSRLPVFVIGHSLGGLAAPSVGARSPPVAGLVLLATPGRPLTQVMLDQLGRSGALDEVLRRELSAVEDGTIADDAVLLGAPGAYWKDLLRRDPIGMARASGTPVLVVRGRRDTQVQQADLDTWVSGLAPGQVTSSCPDEVDHLLARTGQGAGTVAEPVVRAIVDFVSKHSGMPGRIGSAGPGR